MKMLVNYLIAFFIGIFRFTGSAQHHKDPEGISGKKYYEEKQSLRKDLKVKRNKRKYSKGLFRDGVRRAKKSLKSVIVKRDKGKMDG